MGLLTSYSSRWLGESTFAEVFHELNRRKAVAYVHAQDADCCRNLIPASRIRRWETTPTSLVIISLIDSGRALECLDIKFIFSHVGGTILLFPGVSSERKRATAANLAKQADPKSKLAQLRRFYYDTALSTNPIQMQALKRLVSTPQIVFGTESPFNTSSRDCGGAPRISGIFTADELCDRSMRTLERSCHSIKLKGDDAARWPISSPASRDPINPYRSCKPLQYGRID